MFRWSSAVAAGHAYSAGMHIRRSVDLVAWALVDGWLCLHAERVRMICRIACVKNGSIADRVSVFERVTVCFCSVCGFLQPCRAACAAVWMVLVFVIGGNRQLATWLARLSLHAIALMS